MLYTMKTMKQWTLYVRVIPDGVLVLKYIHIGQRVTGDLSALNECCSSSQGCMLLLVLKQHLKQLYGLSDKYSMVIMIYVLYTYLFFYSKCQQYSPTEATKAYDKAPTRKQGVLFNPEFIVTLLKSESHETKINRSKTECLDIYFQVHMHVVCIVS